jgi:hypothetical protein
MGGGSGQSIVSDFGKSAGQDVPQESAEELFTCNGRMAELLSFIVAIAESDFPIVDSFDPTIGDGHAQNVSGQIPQGFVAPAGVQGVNHPGLAPHRWANPVQ